VFTGDVERLGCEKGSKNVKKWWGRVVNKHKKWRLVVVDKEVWFFVLTT